MTQPLRSDAKSADLSADEATLREAILARLTYARGRNVETASLNDWYQATAFAVRDRLVDIWHPTRRETKRQKKKRVY